MDGNNHYSYDLEPLANGDHEAVGQLSTGQLQRLVRLLDGSDVSEIEVRRADAGMHLALRKVRAQEQGVVSVVTAEAASASQSPTVATSEGKQTTVKALLVGIFHSWGKPRGAALIAVGDRVKAGQLVGTIQSLNVINEVEAPMAGRVSEILVQDGQAVEYGQPLVTIDSSEEA